MPTPNISISIRTQTPDERHKEFGPSERRDEVQEPSLEQVYTIGVWEYTYLGRSANP
jgi:hypothetical protein